MSGSSLKRVVFVDDSADVRAANAQSLTLAGLEPVAVASAEEALEIVGDRFEGVVVSDIRMPGMDGLTLFRRLHDLDPALPVILITGHADVATAVAAVQRGAYDFLSKPFPVDELIASVQRALETRGLVLENRELRRRSAEFARSGPLLGASQSVERLRRAIAQIATVSVDVLIQGETGTGKGVVASMLHSQSGRGRRPMVTIDCGALPESLVESELFGHVGGAFAGAQHLRVGRLEQADRSTLFLDEIDTMRDVVQHKLHRVLEAREVTPLGTNVPRSIDIRVIAASKLDLAQASRAGAFSPSLYYRLSGVTLSLPPLRERREDIPLLFQNFLTRAGQRLGREPPSISPRVWRQLHEHDWPGNVRELANFAEHVALGLDSAEFDAQAAPTTGSQGLKHRVGQYEAALIESALTLAQGDVQKALEQLELPRKTFYDKVARHKIDLGRFKPARTHIAATADTSGATRRR
jgi:two-component system C4-dicarboxylate transport response regulator DctD